MRLRELEGWLDKMGWAPEPRKGGCTRAWTHALYPGQRLTYHAPHKADGAELRPDVVKEIYRDLIAMKPTDELEVMEATTDNCIADRSVSYRAEKPLTPSSDNLIA